MIAKFDPIIVKHTKRVQMKSNNMNQYLRNHIQNELMGNNNTPHFKTSNF